MRFWQAVLFCTALLATPAFGDTPKRIVSVNHCADQFLLHLGVNERVASLSFMAGDQDISPHAETLPNIYLNRGRAAEILPLHPDLVIGGTWGAAFALGRMDALGVPVLRLAPVTSLDQAAETLKTLGEKTYIDSSQAIALFEIERKEIAARAQGHMRPTALAIEARGLTSGQGSLRHELMELAGLRNLAAERGIGAYGRLTLEQILAMKPDLLIHVPYAPERPALAEDIFRHPAFDPWRATGRLITIPTRVFNCGTPRALDAAKQMRDAADRWEQAQ